MRLANWSVRFGREAARDRAPAATRNVGTRVPSKSETDIMYKGARIEMLRLSCRGKLNLLEFRVPAKPSGICPLLCLFQKTQHDRLAPFSSLEANFMALGLYYLQNTLRNRGCNTTTLFVGERKGIGVSERGPSDRSAPKYGQTTLVVLAGSNGQRQVPRKCETKQTSRRSVQKSKITIGTLLVRPCCLVWSRV